MDNKNNKVTIRLSDSLKNKLSFEAKSLDKNLSELIRQKLRAKVIYEPFIEISNNKRIPLNQIVNAKMKFVERKI